MTKLFRQAWEEKSTPEDWNINVIMPIFEKGNSYDCNNHQAICLSPVVLKIYTRILEIRLREIVELELVEEQGAYRPLRQTQDHIYSTRKLYVRNSLIKGKMSTSRS
jgi:predicted RNA-binding protein